MRKIETFVFAREVKDSEGGVFVVFIVEQVYVKSKMDYSRRRGGEED